MSLKSLLSILTIFITFNVHAQKGFEVGAWFGGSQYYGDLNSSINIEKPGLGIGVLGMYNFDNRLSVKASLSAGRLRGSDSNATNNFEKNRNLSFYSNVYDANVGFEFNFLPYVHGSDYENMTPYITVGVSTFMFNPKTILYGEIYNLRDYGTEGQLPDDKYSRISWAPTIGGGFKMDLNREISIGFEARLHLGQTDYIDDVSTVYPEYETIRTIYGDEAVSLSNRSINTIAGNPGQQRGNSNNNDKYVFAGIRITKYFYHLKCPKVKI